MIRKLDIASSNAFNFGCNARSRLTGILKTCLPMKKMENDVRTPAIVIHSNPHQMQNIAPAARAKIDSGNMHVVNSIHKETNSTGPQ
jgi:hypothetical protein